MVRADLGDLLEIVGSVLMMRNGMVRIGHAGLGIGAGAQLRAIMNVMTRVRSDWNASTCRSNISLA